MKRVLIITYYWPPTGGGGVQRWLKFAKYLPEFGWKPVIYTPENPDFEITDQSLSKDVDRIAEVIRQPIWEPFGIYRKLLGKRAARKQGVVEKPGSSLLGSLSIWIRANLFIPDPRKFWIKPSVKYLIKYLSENPVDVIVTTGPPHSMHLIGLGIKKSLNIPWIADFRDPWSDWDVLDLLKISASAREKHKKLEKQVFQYADKVLTVSNRLGVKLASTGGIQVEVITNGYDEMDYNHDINHPDKFRISHLGLLNEGRNPSVLWKVLNEICNENKSFSTDLEIYLAGTIGEQVIEDIHSYDKLKSRSIIKGYISHSEAMKQYSFSAMLLLLVNNTSNASWIIPAKLFEYLHTGIPILAYGEKNSDANDILTSTGQLSFVEYSNESETKERLLEAYKEFKMTSRWEASKEAAKYSRRSLTMKLVSILEHMTQSSVS